LLKATIGHQQLEAAEAASGSLRLQRQLQAAEAAQ